MLGIGFGPANIALAVAIEESGEPLRVRFLERQAAPVWQGGMLLDGSDIQNHPARDLATLRNPRSRYTFLNYLFEMGRLVQHLNLPLRFPLRKEYAQYVAWVAHHFDDQVEYGCTATEIDLVQHDGAPAYRVRTESGAEHLGRALVLAPGRTPYVPDVFARVPDDRIFHATQYLYQVAARPAPAAVVVIGGSQSAVEILLDLGARFPEATVTGLQRSFGPRLKDTSPFSEEAFFPEFVDYYHRAPQASKDRLDRELRPTNYSSVDGDVLERLYTTVYEQRLDGRQRLFLRNNTDVTAVEPEAGAVRLRVRDVHTGVTGTLAADWVVLATGFRDLGPGPLSERWPPLLDKVAERFHVDATGRLLVGADYGLAPRDEREPVLFLNGLCESSHGIGDAGSFSLLSLRAEKIRRGLTARLRAAAPAGRRPLEALS